MVALDVSCRPLYRPEGTPGGWVIVFDIHDHYAAIFRPLGRVIYVPRRINEEMPAQPPKGTAERRLLDEIRFLSQYGGL